MRWLSLHKQRMVGIGLLCLAFVAGYQYLFWNVFVDEGDTLAIGWLITRGYRPYVDVWAAHFPLPDYWVAGIVSPFGNSIFAVRSD